MGLTFSNKSNDRSLGAFVLFFICVSLPHLTYAALTPDQQAAKERGIMLYNQYKPAETELRIAAEAGDAEAQFYLGEYLSRKPGYMTSESRHFLEAAANQGDLYAMIRLSKSGGDECKIYNNCPAGYKTRAEWRREAWRVSRDLAAKEDPEGLYIAYRVSGRLDFLIRSAEAGFPFAQYWLGSRYKNGDSFFLLPWGRHDETRRWFKAAAENGIPQAMIEYANMRGYSAIVRHWVEEAAKAGYRDGIVRLAAEYEHPRSVNDFPHDLVKAYGLISLLLVLDEYCGSTAGCARDKLARLSAQMTPEQIEQGKAFVLEWQAAHPRPISFFPMKIDPLDFLPRWAK